MIDFFTQMNKRPGSAKTGSLAALIALAALCPAFVYAEAARYQLIDLGSLGGAQYYETFSGITGRLVNGSGTVASGMDTAVPDPFCFNNSCLTSHGFQWINGSLHDLGTLAFNETGNFSQAFWLNDHGVCAGIATYNALGDSGEPLYKAVMWKDRQIIDLGTLGGKQSLAHAINNQNQVVGWATNLVPASTNIWGEEYPWPFATQQRAVLWENGAARDLGTLGGPSAWASCLNDVGQIIGQSFTANSEGQQHQAAGVVWSRPMAGFIWENGNMMDLGTLGGTFALPVRINNKGQVIGFSTLEGDMSHHPFIWEKGVLKDLGTLGGNVGRANAINEAGEVVGGAVAANGLNRAFLWRNGVMTNLGTLGTHSQAWGINAKTQVIGASGTHPNFRAFLWENGGPMVDLNDLVPAGSPQVVLGLGINDRGEILCGGVNAERLFLLVPAPQLAIRPASAAAPQKIVIEMKLIPGRRYSLEASTDLQTWAVIGAAFVAAADTETRELETSEGSRFYRLTLLP
jgi:probable HAF family extracellular repeat protein